MITDELNKFQHQVRFTRKWANYKINLKGTLSMSEEECIAELFALRDYIVKVD